MAARPLLGNRAVCMLSRARHASPANGVMIALSNWGPGYQWLGPLSIARLIHGTASSVTTPIDQMSTTGPNIIVHKAAVSELPAIKVSPIILGVFRAAALGAAP